MVSAVTHSDKNGYLLKGKYPQLQVLQPPFLSVTLDRLRGLPKAGVAHTVSFLKNKHT